MIRIETLGRIRVFTDNREIKALPSQPIRCALLVYLAIERSATRDKLLGIFWPEQDDKNARHALNQNLYELRKTLGEDWLETQGDQLTIVAPVQLDVSIFEEAVARGDHRVALEVYRGAFLSKGPVVNARGFEEWVDQRAFKLRRAWIRSAQAYVEQLLAAGSIHDAIQVARQVVEAEPQEDQLQHQLIDLLHRAGRRQEALEQYELYERALLEDDLEPLDQTKDLIAAVRAGDGSGVKSSVQPPPPSVQPEPAGSPVAASEERPLVPAGASQTRRSFWARNQRTLTIVTVALGVILSAAFLIDRMSVEDDPDPTPKVAVLYLDAPDPDVRVRTFATELSEGLATAMHPLAGASMIPRNEVALIRNRGIRLDSAANRLNADLLVGGSVTVSGDRVRVRLELIDGKRNTVIGDSHTIDASWPTDSIGFLATLTDAAIAMRSELGREIKLRQRRSATGSDEAWALYLRADSLRDNAVPLIHTGGIPGAVSSLQTADSLLSRAEQVDPNWVAATLLRSTIAEFRAFLLRGIAGQPEQARLWYDTALAHASRAAARRPENVDALEQRGLMRLRIWENLGPTPLEQSAELFTAAESDLQRVVSKDAERSASWIALSTLHHARADFRNELIALLNARKADSYSSQLHDILYRLSFASFELGEDRQAMNYCREGQRRFAEEQSFLYCELALLAWADSLTPDTARAFELVRMLDRASTSVQAHLPEQFRMLAATVSLRARGDRALSMIDQLGKSKSRGTARLEAVARVRAGQFAQAMSLLQQYAAAFPVQSTADLRSRTFAPLQREEAFQALLLQHRPAYIDR